MNIYLQLKPQHIKSAKSIKRIPGIHTKQTKKFGKIYQVKYFIDSGKGPKMFGFSAKEPSFKTILSFDVYTIDLRLGASFILKPDTNEDKLFKLINKVVTTTKYKKPNYKKLKENIESLKQESNTLFSINKTVGMIQLVYGLLFAITVIMLARNMYLQVYNWHQEKEVEGRIEKEMNDNLFQGQGKNDSGFELFNKLKEHIEFITQKKANALIIYGPPGMSKTYTVRRTLYFNNIKPGKEYVIEKGSSLGLLSTYSLLYKNRKRLLILDDFDTPLKDENIVNLLKAITDTYERRILSLPRDLILATGAQGEQIIGVPEKFEYKGQLIIITNLKRNQIDPALLSRAPGVEVKYDTKQILNYTEKLLKYMNPAIPMKFKQETYDYITKLYKNDKNIIVSFRTINSSIEARIGNPQGWKHMIQTIVNYQGKKITENYLATIQR